MSTTAYTRSAFYRDAFANLGPRHALVRLVKKRWGAGPRMLLSSKYLDHPVALRRGSSDLMVFDTIFVEREYSCLDQLGEVRTIVDAGGNCGYSSAYLLSRFPHARVIAVEPDPANFALMSANLAPWGARAVCVEAALWSHNTVLEFEDDSTGAGNEWGRRTSEGTGNGSVSVTAIDMPTLMQTHGLDRIDLLKVDIEGAETQLFASNPPWLEAVGNIVMELHGPDCEQAVDQAMAQYAYRGSRSGELSVFLDIRRAA